MKVACTNYIFSISKRIERDKMAIQQILTTKTKKKQTYNVYKRTSIVSMMSE